MAEVLDSYGNLEGARSRGVCSVAKMLKKACGVTE